MSKDKKLKADKKIEKRGGPRIGAGRPPKENKVMYKCIAIDPIAYEFLLQNSIKNKESIRNFLNRLINLSLFNQQN